MSAGAVLAAVLRLSLLALAAGSAGAQNVGISGPGERAFEARLPEPMPAVPKAGDTIEFYVSPVTTNRFAIDPASLRVESEKVVQFTLIVTSGSGVRNATYEAIRCDRGEQRLLAVARADDSWSVLRNSQWRRLNTGDTVNRQHPELFARLCSGGAAAALDTARLLARLRSGPERRY
ncbi:MAG: hypothetical protein KJZ83_16990 [Burkholderiaceae bacterium]|nr:hypothetical protein [Burkholderiaceae bacterium]